VGTELPAGGAGVTLAKTGVLAAIPWFVAAVATVLGGWMFDRWFNDRPRRVIVPSMLVTAVFLWFMTQSQTVGEFVLFETLGMAAMWVSFMPIFGCLLAVVAAATMPQNPETFQRRLALNTRDDAKAV
jgi:membrane protein YqaA with SNARE-associated domain